MAMVSLHLLVSFSVTYNRELWENHGQSHLFFLQSGVEISKRLPFMIEQFVVIVVGDGLLLLGLGPP